MRQAVVQIEKSQTKQSYWSPLGVHSCIEGELLLQNLVHTIILIVSGSLHFLNNLGHQ